MSDPIRLLLIDHPTLSRRGLAALLARRRDLRVVGEADNGAEARALAEAVGPDVVIVDTHVPGGGATLVADLRRAQPRCAVLVLTEDERDEAMGDALRAGARGYVQKNCEPEDLVRAIQRIYLGELLVTSPAADLLRALARDQAQSNGLTERELQVLQLVARGYTNRGIAEELSITEHTAKEHLANILGKLGLENRVQVATYAVQHGLAAGANGAA
jgi:two-component system, NarL family, nitrate/nitrite response regulator NarL